MEFECASRTHVGLRRKINEDSLLVATDRGIWAVADGMGGHEAGEVASGRIVEALGRVRASASPEQMTSAAVDALSQLNHDLIKLARTGARPRTIGSTVVGLAVAGGEYRCFWAGDSRAYRIRGERILQLSRDHSLVQDLVDAGMLDPAEAEHHPNANVITRAVGVAEQLAVETRGGSAKPGDQFLLASDGLTRLVDEDELLDELRTSTPEQAADNLLQSVLARGAPDNVTLIIVRLP